MNNIFKKNISDEMIENYNFTAEELRLIDEYVERSIKKSIEANEKIFDGLDEENFEIIKNIVFRKTAQHIIVAGGKLDENSHGAIQHILKN